MDILLEEYQIFDHHGERYKVSWNLAIQDWRTPDPTDVYFTNCISAIKNGYRFELECRPDMYQEFLGYYPQIKGKSYASNVCYDLSKYPILSSDRQSRLLHFELYIKGTLTENDYMYITGKPWEFFLNDTERIFYLLHGYGRPCMFVSLENYRIRQFLKTVPKKALSHLGDPEGLSDIDLQSIPSEDYTIVYELSLVCDHPQLYLYLSLKGSRLLSEHPVRYTKIHRGIDINKKLIYNDVISEGNKSLVMLERYLKDLSDTELSVDTVSGRAKAIYGVVTKYMGIEKE